MRAPVLVLGVLCIGACQGDVTDRERALLSDLALQPLPASPTNAFADDDDAAALGHALFFDARFSGPLVVAADGENGGLGPAGAVGLVSCSSCHQPNLGGSDHRSRAPTSLAAGFTARNAPTVLNAAFGAWMFWDGRKDAPWSQALGPVESGVEHNTSRLHVAQVLFDHYRAPFEALFGAMPPLDDFARFPDTSADPTRGRPGDATWTAMASADQTAVSAVFASFGKSIEAYERKLVDASSPFDRFVGGVDDAMSESAVRGAKLFVGRAACNECHRGPQLSDGLFHNHGVPDGEDLGRAGGIPKVLSDEFNGAGAFSDDVDAGTAKLANLVATSADLGAFKTPTLRNAARTAPYMHTGQFASLWDCVDFYRTAAGTDGFVGTRDARVAPLDLSDDDVNDLVAFLESLTGDPLPSELVNAPVLP